MAEPKKIIEPRTLKGFRDFLPETMIPREKMIARVSEVYRRYGYSPIDTPVLEYLEILSGKGSDETDRQLYKFKDHGGREVGMRFDLTVPFARFSAQHAPELVLPFKRYHIAKVWRGENTQAGRYREFSQCDFDVIGTTSVMSDIETALVINDVMQRVDLRTDEPFTRFKIHVNSRKILNGLLEKINLADRAVPVLRALDKLAKIGREKVIAEMAETAGASEEQAGEILDMVLVQATSIALSIGRTLRLSHSIALIGANSGWKESKRSARYSTLPAQPEFPKGVSSWTCRSPAGSITTPARSSRRSSTTCPRWGASPAAGGTTTWPGSIPRRRSPESAPRSGSTGFSPVWKSLECSKRSLRRSRC